MLFRLNLSATHESIIIMEHFVRFGDVLINNIWSTQRQQHKNKLPQCVYKENSQHVLLPAGLEKSRTLVAGCSRSGLLDDRFPGMGMMATL